MDNIVTIEDNPNIIIKKYKGKWTFTWNNVIPNYTEGFTLTIKTELGKDNEYEVDWDNNLEGMRYDHESRVEWENEIINLYKVSQNSA